jgi:conjugative transfer signal peptidase TraF
MLKRLVAVGGDDVQVDADGVRVNGKLQPRSLPLLVDPGGRPLPRPPALSFRVTEEEVLMLSDYSPLSFDGRYFGVVPRAQLEEVVKPWVVWEHTIN